MEVKVTGKSINMRTGWTITSGLFYEEGRTKTFRYRIKKRLSSVGNTDLDLVTFLS